MKFVKDKLLKEYPINLEIAKDQDEYVTLPGHIFRNNYGTFLCGLELSEEELKKLNDKKRLYVVFQTFYKPLTPFKICCSEEEARELINYVQSE